MSVTIRTYVLYGTIVDVSNYDTTRFEDEMEYVDYLYDVINKCDSPYKIIYNEDNNEYYFGYVIDEGCDGNWDNKYLSTQSFSAIAKKVTPEIEQAVDWFLLINFDMRSSSSDVELMILTVYC